MMIPLKQRILLCVLGLFMTPVLIAQSNYFIKGVIRDLSTNQPVPFVNILFQGEETGKISDANGTFVLKTRSNEFTILFTHVSFQDKSIHIDLENDTSLNLGSIMMEPRVVGLGDVHVIASFVSERGTPVAVSTISAKTIEKQTGDQDYPEILKLTPGVYATKVGGGSGDDRLSIRGFQQENIALLLNGVPVSSMENGLVYWSNWGGLGDATEAIQVQRGLGASKVAMNSVGGTVNIITKSTNTEKGGSLRYSLSSYGNQKSVLHLSTGRLNNGFAITFLGSRINGPGYVDGTYVNGWSYFLSVSKEFNLKHKLVFTAMGSPERHGQRNYSVSSEEHEKFGNRYNSSWGVYKGKIFNLSENFYHKPQINLNHYWNINQKVFLATSAYLSFGYGGGRFSRSYNVGYPTIFGSKKNDQIDFDAVYAENISNSDSTQIEGGKWISGYSKTILTNFRANHYWIGVLSTLNYAVNDKLKVTAGVHVRNFRSRLYEEVDDLMGGDFWVEQYSGSKSGVAGRDQIMKLGDVINLNNYSIMEYRNLFVQAEYQDKKFKCFLSSTVSGTLYQRKDPYNYTDNLYSRSIRKKGFDVKTGASYELGTFGNLYANLGFYSREPYYKFVFVNNSNDVTDDLRNEKISAAELGYEYNQGHVTARLNGYYTLWVDKSILSFENKQLADSLQKRSLVKGLDAIHKGVELEITALLFRNLSASASFSLGNWKWQNDVIADFYDDNQVLTDSSRVYSKGLFVGDAPQTQLGASVDYTFLDQFNFVVNWVYFDRLYANFDPVTRNDPGDRNQPFRIPAYGIVDLYLGHDFTIGKFPSSLQLSCQNLFNKDAITRGEDGLDHTLSTFKGFWAQGRTFNISMKLQFK